jgi:succinoglycan biosynthesis protein ExoA
MSTLKSSRSEPNDSAASQPSRPFISVVVPVRNEARAIAATLLKLLRQTYGQNQFEVIVVDGESTDDTWQIVQSLIPNFPNLKLFANPQRWSSAARNIGVREARGDLIVIVDGHCDIGTADYLTQLAAAFERTRADCIGRPQPLEIAQPNNLQRAIGIARASRLGHHPASYVFSTHEQQVPAHSVAVAYRRSVFDRVGLFDESFDACEDVEFNHRVDQAGLRCFLVPALRVSYHPRATLGGLFRQMMRYGQGRVRLLRKHPETFSPLGFAPGLFLMFLLAGPLAAFFSPTAGFAYAACLLVYALVVAGVSAALAIREWQISLAAYLPVVFATLHLGAGTGILFETCKPRRGAPRDQSSQNCDVSSCQAAVGARCNE